MNLLSEKNYIYKYIKVQFDSCISYALHVVWAFRALGVVKGFLEGTVQVDYPYIERLPNLSCPSISLAVIALYNNYPISTRRDTEGGQVISKGCMEAELNCPQLWHLCVVCMRTVGS